MNAINLVPPARRERAAVRRRVRTWTIGGGSFMLAVAGAATVVRLAGGQETSRLASDTGRLEQRIAAAQQELKEVQGRKRETLRAKEAAETVGVHPDWSVLLAALSRLRDEDILLQSIDVHADAPPAPAPRPRAAEDGKPAPEGAKARPRPHAPEGYTVVLRGFGLSHAEVVKFVRRLERAGPLHDVRLRETRAQEHRGVEAFGFSAEFRLSEEPGAAAEPARADAEGRP